MVNQKLLDYIKQQTQPGSFSPQHKGLNKTLIAIVSIIGGILIIGGGVFAYSNYFQSPEKIAQKMMVNLAEIKSLEYSGEIKTEINTDDLLGGSSSFLQPRQSTSDKKKSNFLINFTGLSDIQNPNTPKSQFSFNIKTDALTQKEFIFGLEVKTIDKIIYIKLSDVPNLGFFDLSAIKNQWIKIDNEVQKKQELALEQIEKLKTVVQQAKIFKITEKLASEKIEGVNTYHYKFIIDKEGVKNLFIEIGKIVQDKTLTEKELADLDEGLEGVESPEGEIWIGKKDLLPYKITLSSMIKETDKSKISGEVSFTLLLKNFNKPVQIDTPQQAKPLEEFLKELFRGVQGVLNHLKSD